MTDTASMHTLFLRISQTYELPLKEIAARSGLTLDLLRKWDRGEGTPKAHHADKIAEAFPMFTRQGVYMAAGLSAPLADADRPRLLELFGRLTPEQRTLFAAEMRLAAAFPMAIRTGVSPADGPPAETVDTSDVQLLDAFGQLIPTQRAVFEAEMRVTADH